MRELRPLNLPKLVASRKHTESSTDKVPEINNDVKPATSNNTSSLSSAATTPLTPVFLAFAQTAVSNVASAAPSPTCSPISPLDTASSQYPMPSLPEDPRKDITSGQIPAKLRLCTSDLDEAFPDSLLLSTHHGKDVMNQSYLEPFHPYDIDPDDYEECLFGKSLPPPSFPSHSRQASNDSPISNISTRLGDKIPSFTKRWVHRKNNSSSSGEVIGFAVASRSSSFASSYRQELGAGPSLTSLPRNVSSVSDPSSFTSPVEQSLFPEFIDDPIDRQAQSSTPLLPPMMSAPAKEESLVQSPLQSPAFAATSRAPSTVSARNSEASQIYYDRLSFSLSTQGSVKSIQRTRASTNQSTDGSVPLIIAPPDKWSNKLGHANFTIFPEPYLPDVFSLESYDRLVSHWKEACEEFCKHQARTLEHFGPNSKTFQLTEEKWAEIDAEWKGYVEKTSTKAISHGASAEDLTSSEPPTFVRMPSINPHVDGKFPKLNDEDIVGPMATIPPRVQPPARRSTASKVINDLKSGLFGKK